MLRCFNILLFTLLASAFVCSCAKEEQVAGPPDVPLTHSLNIPLSAQENVTAEIGNWMFAEDELSGSAIANWLGKEYFHVGFKKLLEPINLVWMDFRSENEEEATENIINFMKDNGFELREGSSTGYWGYIDGQWLGQVGTTWSDHSSPHRKNNHGRLFASKLVSTGDTTLYISTAAFSIQNAFHDYVSFDEALEDFKAAGEWQLLYENHDLNNEVCTENYTTDDHQGAKIFVLK